MEKTGRVVIVEEGPKTGGVSGEIAAGLMEHCGESLISPVVRVASADVPVPFTPVLENAYRPDPSRRLFRCSGRLFSKIRRKSLDVSDLRPANRMASLPP